MNIVEDTKQRLVIEDTNAKTVGIGAAVLLLLLAALLVAMGLWTDGFIPGTASYHARQIEGWRRWWFTLGFGICGLFCIVLALLQSYSRTIFDKAQGYVTIVRIRPVSRATKRATLNSVRTVRVDSLGDIQRLEIELKTGEKLLPRRTYNNYDRPDTLQGVAERINEFLARY